MTSWLSTRKMKQTSPRAPADEPLLSALESTLLVAGGPVSVAALAHVLEVPKTDIVQLLQALGRELRRGIRLQVHADHAQLVTAPENVTVVQRYLGAVKPPALSRPALEALTVIAYKQPITRSEIEAARGANSDRAVQTLLARGLIEERGHRQTLGRPMEYGTSFGFLEYFGLDSLEELPPLAEQRGSAGLEVHDLGLRAARGQRAK